MRFRGGGVGHNSTRDATNHFLTDRHPTDLQPHAGPHQAESEEDIISDEEMSEDPIPDLEGATVPSNDSDLQVADVEAAALDEVDDHGAEDDYGYNKGDSDDDEDDAEEREKQGLPEDEYEEDEVEELGFARF